MGESILSEIVRKIPEGLGTAALTKNRDELHTGIVKIAMSLDVSCEEFSVISTHNKYLELIDRIIEFVKKEK